MFKKLKEANKRVDVVVSDHEYWKSKYDKLFESNEAAVILHNKVQAVFKKEAQEFFADRIKWKTDLKTTIDHQDVRMDRVIAMMEQSRREVVNCTGSFSSLTDCVIMQHLLQENIINDLRQVGIMGAKTERELMLPEALKEKQVAGSHKPSTLVEPD